MGTGEVVSPEELPAQSGTEVMNKSLSVFAEDGFHAEKLVRSHVQEVIACMGSVIKKRVPHARHDDILQTAWSDLLRGICHYTPNCGKLSTYIGAAAANAVKMHYRSMVRKPEGQTQFSIREHDVPSSPERDVYGIEEVRSWIVGEPDQKMRSILEARFIRGSTLQEAGDQVGLTKEAVRLRIDAWIAKKKVDLGLVG